MPAKCSSICHNPMASGGAQRIDLHQPATATRDTVFPMSLPFLQSSYDLNDIFYRQRRVRYQWTENRVDDFVGLRPAARYRQRQSALRRRASKAAKSDYDNFLFNAGIVAHLTERQQTWFNFSQGVRLPDPGKYYGIGKYGAAVNGHLPLISSVNVDDSPLQGIKS